MSKLLTKMNLIAIIQQLPEDDIEFVQTYITTLEENNQAMQEELARTWEKLDKKEEIIKKAIDYIKPKLSMKDDNGFPYLLFKRTHIEHILQILERTENK